MGLVYIVAGFVLLMLIGAVAYQLRLARHNGVPREKFIEEFVASGIPSEIPAAVYDHYRSFCRAKGFSVAPDDSFEKIFRQVHDDVDDDAEELANKLGMDLPSESVLKEFATPVETLRDMVLWLNWIRQQQNAAGCGGKRPDAELPAGCRGPSTA
jgi:hypothetical protein